MLASKDFLEISTGGGGGGVRPQLALGSTRAEGAGLGSDDKSSVSRFYRRVCIESVGGLMRPSGEPGRALVPWDNCLKTSFGLEVSIFSFFLNDLKGTSSTMCLM